MSVSPCCTTVSLHSCAVPHLRCRSRRATKMERRLVVDDLVEEAEHASGAGATSATAYEPSRLARKQIASSWTASPNSRCCTGGRATQSPPVKRHAHRVQQTEAGAPPSATAHRRRRRGFSTVGSTISCSGSSATCAEPPVASATAGPCVRRRTSPGRSGRAMERDAGGTGKAHGRRGRVFTRPSLSSAQLCDINSQIFRGCQSRCLQDGMPRSGEALSHDVNASAWTWVRTMAHNKCATLRGRRMHA